MNTKAKKVIKGIAKNTGKYTLKGLGKGVELAGRGAVQVVDSIIKDPALQEIVTSAGILAASVAVPSVGVALMTTVGLKYAIDRTFLGNNKSMLDEINDILQVGNTVTRNVSDKILRPTLKNVDKSLKDIGKDYQDTVDDFFR